MFLNFDSRAVSQQRVSDLTRIDLPVTIGDRKEYRLQNFGEYSMIRSTGFLLVTAAFVLKLVLTITVGNAVAAEQPAALDDDQRFTRLTAPVDDAVSGGDSSALGRIHARRFEALWSDHDYGAGLGEASDEAVLMRLRAAGTAAFYETADWVLARYRAALAEANGRGIATREHVSDLFDFYLAASRHDQARALVRRYPEFDLPEVPQIVSPGAAPSESSRMLWRVAEDPLRLEGFHVDLDAPRLLIVSSPGCGFCRMAARALPADEVLGPLMREHAIWVAAKSWNNTYRRMLRFNREYPEAPQYFVDNPETWPVPGFAATPRFHFIEGTVSRETLAGWQGGSETLWAIARGFESIGLLDAESLPEDVFAYADE
ncbi:MAG: hypothetical protein KGY53_02310 [Wenzhouxiangellaceae bacterium]|nr:hypothetical protein [Wenzhouxiangellaceae bacterium]